MQVRIELLTTEKDAPTSERKNLVVETHVKRGDLWIVHGVDYVLEGSSLIFNPTSEAKLVVLTPRQEEVELDPVLEAMKRYRASKEPVVDSLKAPEIPIKTPAAPPRPTPPGRRYVSAEKSESVTTIKGAKL